MPEPNLIIDAKKVDQRYVKDLWSFRELFLFLAWRDVEVMYTQTVIGLAWSIIRPLLTMCIFTIVFSRIAKLPSDSDVPYAIMVFCAMLPWQFFSTSLSKSSLSLTTNKNMVSKVYFPRMILPASSVIFAFVDFLIAFCVLLVLMFFYQIAPSWKIVFLPLFISLAALSALGFGLWLSALNVKYRDFQHIVPFIIQLGLYISPVGFNSSVIPEQWRMLYSLNPMAGVIDGAQWSIIGRGSTVFLPGLALSCLMVVLIFVSGFLFFRKTEKEFADFI